MGFSLCWELRWAHRWTIENSAKSQMVYFFLYFTEQAISTTFFLLHFALGNPVDWKKNTKLKRNVKAFTFSAVSVLTL